MADKTPRPGKIRCDACPVMCYIAEGQSGACDRYANENGQLIRLDPLTIIAQRVDDGGPVVPFLDPAADWDGDLLAGGDPFITAVGAGTTYPDYKPAPFIVSREVDGVDMITVVTEGIFSYCGVKVKIDTDRHLGPERSPVRVEGEPVGHVSTGEYGSQMLSLGGVGHLTGGGKKEGRVTCAALLDLCNRKPVELAIDDGRTIVVEAGRPPIVDGVVEQRMRVGCGSAAIGMFAAQWRGLADDVVVVDDHITGVVSEHQAGKVLGWENTGIRVAGRKSTPGRYFQVAEPGAGWGGTNLEDPLDILEGFDPRYARPGQTLLMLSTTGEHHAYYVLDEALVPVERDLPEALLPSVRRITENCEPALCSVLFMGGAGGSLRSGVTENPVSLTRSVKSMLTLITVGGAPAYIWPGGGITIMADVTRTPEQAFGYVPTPALVAPIEFTMRRQDFQTLGGHMDRVQPIADVLRDASGGGTDHIVSGRRPAPAIADNPWPTDRRHYRWNDESDGE